MSKYKIGDKVYVKKLRGQTAQEYPHLKNGMVGTVLEEDSRPWVEFEEFIGGGNSYRGSRIGYTMCMWEDEIEFLHSEPTPWNPVKLTVDNISISPYITACVEGPKTELKGDNKNMKILNIYEDRVRKEINELYETERKSILEKDIYQSIGTKAAKEIARLYKSETGKELQEETISIHSCIKSKDTEVKLEELKKKNKLKHRNLDELLEEVNAQLELTNDYDKQVEILKNYGILDKKGQINA